MTEQESSRILTVSQIVALESWDNGSLAALNLALAWEGRPVPQVNLAFEIGVKAALLRADGWPHDRETLRDALAYVINERIANGSWV